MNGGRFHPWESFTITRAPVAGAASYVYEYDDEPSFAYPGTTLGDGVTTGTTLNGNYGFLTTQYVCVRSVNAAGVRGLPSAALCFDITYAAPIPPPPTLVAPVGGASVAMPLTFEWTSVANEQPAGYELQIDDEPTFTGGCGSIDLCVTGISGSQYTLTSFPSAVRPGVKYWRVRSSHGEASAGTGGPGSGPAAVSAWSATGSVTLPSTAPSLVGTTVDVFGGGGTVLRSHTQVFSGTTGDNLAYLRVQLDAPAPAGGAAIALASSNAAVAAVPASATIAQGESQGTFRIEPQQVTDTTTVTLSATFAGRTLTAPLTVLPTELQRLDVAAGRPSPRAFSGGTSTVGTLLFNGIAPAGSVIALASSAPAATVPATITTPALTPTSFTIATSAVDVPTDVTLTATWRGRSVSEQLTLYPAPTLLTPASGAAIAAGQAVVFDWNTVASGFTYDLEVDDASTFTAPLVLEQTVSASAFSASALPTQRMWWRVRANDASGRPGAWSAVRQLELK